MTSKQKAKETFHKLLSEQGKFISTPKMLAVLEEALISFAEEKLVEEDLESDYLDSVYGGNMQE